MLETQEVISLIKVGVSNNVRLARERAARVNMHITGANVSEFLETLENYENTTQKKLRDKLLKSNKSLFSFLLRPLDKVFTAKGGSIAYNLQERQIDSLKELISDVSDGLNIKDFLKKKAKARYLIDPNGFVMVDVDNESRLATNLYSSNDVIWYDKRGNKVNGIIFNPFKSCIFP